jgi:hypothetical protein
MAKKKSTRKKPYTRAKKKKPLSVKRTPVKPGRQNAIDRPRSRSRGVGRERERVV